MILKFSVRQILSHLTTFYLIDWLIVQFTRILMPFFYTYQRANFYKIYKPSRYLPAQS